MAAAVIAVWALLAAGRRRPLSTLPPVASSLGILWSLDVGVCAVVATAIVILLYTRA